MAQWSSTSSVQAGGCPCRGTSREAVVRRSTSRCSSGYCSKEKADHEPGQESQPLTCACVTPQLMQERYNTNKKISSRSLVRLHLSLHSRVAAGVKHLSMAGREGVAVSTGVTCALASWCVACKLGQTAGSAATPAAQAVHAAASWLSPQRACSPARPNSLGQQPCWRRCRGCGETTANRVSSARTGTVCRCHCRLRHLS